MAYTTPLWAALATLLRAAFAGVSSLVLAFGSARRLNIISFAWFRTRTNKQTWRPATGFEYVAAAADFLDHRSLFFAETAGNQRMDGVHRFGSLPSARFDRDRSPGRS